MKIDILVGVAYRGGVEEVINETAKYLKRNGHSIRILQCIWQEKDWVSQGLYFSYFFNAEKDEWSGNYNDIAGAYKAFAENEGYPDVVLAAGWPVLVPIVRAVVEQRAKVISWMHGDLQAYVTGGFGGYPELAAADAHFCINHVLANGILENIRDAKTFLVRNPLNLERIIFNENRDAHRLAYVGRLSSEKNIPYLLQLFSKTNENYILDVVGDTDVPGGLQMLDEYCKSLGVQERVFFHGWLDNPWEVLEDSAALLLTSDREGASLVAKEALLCGMYVITTPTEGPTEFIVHEKNGFFIPFATLDSLSRLLDSLNANELQIPKPGVCRESVANLLEEEELKDFESFLFQVYERKIKVEMVIPQLAEKGGLDKIINAYVDYLLNNEDIELRVVQLVDSGLVWWNGNCSVESLYKVKDNPSFMDSAEAYAEYLEQTKIKPDLILATGWPVTITIVREALRRTGFQIPLIGYLHMTLKESEKTGVGGVSCLNDADVIFSISKQIDLEIENTSLPIKTIRVNNGIEFPKECSHNNKMSSKVLLYIGRLVDGKNLPMIFRAIAGTKENWNLRIVGQGELEKAKAQAKDAGVLDRVEFCGFKADPYENAEDVMFCVMPSNYEGFCLVIPEALSRGIPVISTPVGCATEVIRPGENGYLIGIDDSAMLTEILDMVSDGALPVPDATTCRDSVLRFEQTNTFESLNRALMDVYSNYKKD